jgi:alkanesulfonate monooxygenase SsuD/methylene tetrahydromethanopterin reductase-like flavin-dependent oxidoreductase (luciferase family)
VDENERLNEDWNVLMSFLPADWRRLARKTDALKGLRRNKSAEGCLRTLLIHLACGYSLRETAVRAREAHLANLSDVAVLKRLRKSEQWLYELCCALFEETHLSGPESASVRRIRLVDATQVKEPGKHVGRYFRVPGFNLSEPSPQRTPVLYQAGASRRGKDFAAKHAECVFVSAPSASIVKKYVHQLFRLAASVPPA